MQLKIEFTDEEKGILDTIVEKCKNSEEPFAEKGFHRDMRYLYVVCFGYYIIIESRKTGERILEINCNYNYIWNLNKKALEGWFADHKENNGS